MEKARRNTKGIGITQYGQWLRASPVITNGLGDKRIAARGRVQTEFLAETEDGEERREASLHITDKPVNNRASIETKMTQGDNSNKGKGILQLEFNQSTEHTKRDQKEAIEENQSGQKSKGERW